MFTPEPTLSKRIEPTPRACNSNASCAALPFVPCRSGDVQSRSVGPLPAKNTTPGHAPSLAGSEMVEGNT